jgi:purine-binding chemotaxis protein CheW
MEQAAVALATDHRQYLTFTLGAEEYGLDILRVQEIRGFSAITPIPNMPPHIRGVMNLRGTVIPVLDLRAKFGLDAVEYTKFSVIIIATVGERITGMVVDAVSDVLNIAAADVRPCPDFGARVDTRFVSGMVNTGEHLAVLLDVDRLLKEQELAAVAQAEQAMAPQAG